MKIAKISVEGVNIRAQKLSSIPKGIVGGTIELEFSGDVWDNLTKTVVFRGYAAKDVLDAGNVVTIPPEVVAASGYLLRVGVYGTDVNNTIVIPTLWCDLGRIVDAADPSGDPSTEPSLPVWAKILKDIGNLNDLRTEAKESLVKAINEIYGNGGADWNAAEGQPGHVKNRTHFAEPDVTIFPETYLIDGNPGYWDNMELVYCIADCPGSLVAGKTYVVTINGTDYIGVAYKSEYSDDIIFDSETGKFTIYYNPGGVSFIPDEKLVLVANYLADPYTWEPITFSIIERGKIQKLSSLFLDMEAIRAALPSVEMTATLDDGSTRTFRLYGEAVTE